MRTTGPARRFMPRGACVLTLGLFIATAPLPLGAQQLLEFTPNTRAAWTLGAWQPALVLSHRLELVSGGDELFNVMTMTLGTAIRERMALGLDFTSNSEVSAANLGGNETQWWAAFRGPSGGRGALSGLIGYSTAARSLDGGVTLRGRAEMVSLIAEVRAFSNAFGTGDAGFAGAGGVVLHLTPFLSLAGDLGRAFSPDTFGTVWSGALALAIPGTRHHFSFHATNGGATTLQGTSRAKVIGPEEVRYGFAFVAPLGTGSQWARIFRRGSAAPESATGTDSAGESGDTIRVNIRDLAFSPATIRIKVGQTVQWVNADPLAHTVTADDKSWGSGFLNQGERYSRRFTAVGSFPYHCEPHPQMRGTVIVER